MGDDPETPRNQWHRRRIRCSSELTTLTGIADPQCSRYWFDCDADHCQHLLGQLLQVHVSPKTDRQPFHLLFGVVASPIESTIHPGLDPASQRVEEGRSDQACSSHQERRPLGQADGLRQDNGDRGVNRGKEANQDDVAHRATEQWVDLEQSESENRYCNGHRKESHRQESRSPCVVSGVALAQGDGCHDEDERAGDDQSQNDESEYNP